ncbi:solute carrier family 35 member G1-like [Glandiceps talaboti]
MPDPDSPVSHSSEERFQYNDRTPILSEKKPVSNGDERGRFFDEKSSDQLTRRERYKQWMKSALGIVLALTSGCSFAIGYMFAAFALMVLTPFQTVFIVQGIIGLIMIPPIIMFKIDVLLNSHRDRLLLIANGIGYTIGEAGLYFALANLPIGNVNAIFMGSLPIITAILSTIFLREPWRCVHGVVAVINIAGILLISQPTFIFGERDDHSHSLNANHTLSISVEAFGYLSTVGGATGYAMSYITCRALSDDVSMLTIILWDSIVAGVICSTLTFSFENPKWKISGRNYGMIVGIAIFDCIGHWMAFRSVQLENAATASLLFNFEVVVSYTLDYFVFGTHIGWFEIGGVALILLSACVISAVTWKENQAKQHEVKENDNGYMEFKSLD